VSYVSTWLLQGGLWAPTDCPNKKLKVDNFLANNPISLSQVNEAIEYVDSNDTKLVSMATTLVNKLLS